MTLAGKRLAAVSFLAAFAVWPAVHRGLVAHYATDPWALHGWAMYCVPRTRPRVELAAETPVGRVRIDPRFASDVERAYRRFVHDRRILGDLATPDELAAVSLEILTEASAVEVTVRRARFDAGSGRMERRERRYRVARPD